MADTLVAKANVGAGTDSLAVDNIAGGAAGVVKVALGIAGAVDGYVSGATPMPVAAASLPLPAGAATEATLATVAGTVGNSNSPYVPGSTGQIMLARRRDTDSSPAADGDLTVFNIDEEGRLKVATKPATYAAVTGSVAAVAQTVFADCQRFSNLMIHCTGTFGTVNCTFEGSLNSTNGTDGNWFLVQAIRSSTNTIETTTGNLSAAPAYAWELSVNALKFFRVRCTARTSGTQDWTFIPGTYATEPVPGAQVSATQPVSGTVTANTTPTAATASIVNSAATTNGTVVKASAGTLYSITASNTGAAVAFLKLHNSTTVTVGTTAVAMTIPIPAGAVLTIPFGSQGMRYGTGICLSITNLAADTDTTAVAASQVKTNIAFI